MLKNILLISVFCISTLFAGVDFSAGNRHKWRCFGFKSAKFVKGVGFQGVSTGNSRMISEKLAVSAKQTDFVEMVFEGKLKSAKLYFHDAENLFNERAMVRGEVEPQIVIFEVHRNARWKGNISAFRLDLYGADKVVIKSLRFRKGDGTVSLKSPWMAPQKIRKGQVFSVRREPRFPRQIFFRGNCSQPLKLTCRQFDIFGKQLHSETLSLKRGICSGAFRFIPSSAAFSVQIVNNGKADGTFDLALFQKEKETVRKTPEAKVVVHNVPEKTDENTVWTPQVTFPEKVPAGTRLRLRLLGQGALNIIISDTAIGTGKSQKYILPPVSFKYLTPGKYVLAAETDDVPCEMTSRTIIHTRKKAVVPPTVRIDRSGSRPFYVINGREKADTMEYLISDPPPSPRALQQAAQAFAAGVKGIRVRLIFRFTPDGKVTFDEIDSAMQSILARMPEANLMIHVSVTDPGPQFRARYPQEGIRDEHGNFKIKNYRNTPEPTSSMASEKWLKDSQKMLGLLIKHLNNTPQGERVIGILPCSGITWEWLNWGSARGVMVDYSTHYHKYFVSYLKRVYNNDLSALNKAWKKNYSSFEDVEIPSPQRRKESDLAEFRTPFAYQPEIDLADSVSCLIADNVATLCRTVKQVSNGRLLSGSYYGYTVYLNGAFRAQNAGHHALNRLLNFPDVDIVSAPSRYAGRELGGGSGFMFPAGSIRLHKKLIISECDDRPINADSATGRSATVAASRSAFERAYAMQFAAGSVMRWFDFSKGWVMDEPRMLDVVRKLSHFDTMMRKIDPAPLADNMTAAVITAERSAAVLSPDSALHDMLLEWGYRSLISSGVSFSIFNVEDIHTAVKSRKLVLLLNLFRLKDNEKTAVEKLFAEKGRIIFASSGIGLFNNDGKFDVSFVSKLFNSRFEISRERKLRTCRTTELAEKLFGIPRNTIISTAKPCGDVLYPTGKQWLPLALTDDGKIALGAEKINGSWRIWSAFPVIPAELLQGMAKMAKMPVIRAPKASVWFNNGYGFVHSAGETEAVVEMPQGFSGICEFPDFKKVPAISGTVRKKIGAGKSWLFYFVSEK